MVSTVKHIALTVLLMMASSNWAVAATPVLIYNSIPGPLPPNVPSLGYQAQQTSEFGDLIQFSGTDRTLTRVNVVMSDGALASDYPTYPGANGPSWNHPLTINLYNVDNSGANPAPGTLIATRTQTFSIPWRPPADATCANPSYYRASDGNCYSGLAFSVTFDFSGTTVPDQIIYGLAYNTETYGYNPIGSTGPYISLNFGLSSVAPTVGSNPFPDTAYWNTSRASNYTDGGTAGVGIFRRDTAWSPYSGAVSFETVVVRSDFNGDGKSDVSLQNVGSGDVAVWLMDGSTITSGAVVGSPGTSWKIVATGDFDNDGKADLLLQNSTTGDVAEWRMNGMSIIAGLVIGTPGPSWRVVGTGDFNGDGKSDIILQNSTTGDVAEWQMNGMTITSGLVFGSPGPSGKVAATGDFNGDGMADILLQDSGSGAVTEWQMSGNTILSSMVIDSPATAWKVVGTGDFNGDGMADIILQNSTTGDVAEWQMNGNTIIAGLVIGTPGTGWVLLGAADYNGDGKADILLQNPTTGEVAEWQMNGMTITAGSVVGTPNNSWVAVVK
jgi:FG-GAP-like repeat